METPDLSKEKVKDCCKQSGNLKEEADPSKPTIAVFRCQVCGLRHFAMDAEPGHFGLEIGKIGT
jgi:hypothetical protein